MGTWDKDTITNFVHSWYSRLNDHAPFEEVRAMLSNEGIEMRFPETTLTTYPQFEAWYRGVTKTFFNQSHIVQKLDVTMNGDTAELTVTVNWRAHTWQPPQAYSTWINAVAGQKWKVVRDPATGNPLIKKYIVETFKPV
jgi:SnoaL-like protein